MANVSSAKWLAPSASQSASEPTDNGWQHMRVFTISARLTFASVQPGARRPEVGGATINHWRAGCNNKLCELARPAQLTRPTNPPNKLLNPHTGAGRVDFQQDLVPRLAGVGRVDLHRVHTEPVRHKCRPLCCRHEAGQVPLHNDAAQGQEHRGRRLDCVLSHLFSATAPALESVAAAASSASPASGQPPY